ncbi:MAG: glycosyltransferase family 2 protein [Deltaproteobacteria bacterium]|nr:glycosyltransferase family 2 protein [Deltaproteobacteria bacterium]
MTTILVLSIFNSFGIIIFFLGIQGILFLPLTIIYEYWKKRALKIIPPFQGNVTVLIPAYNEDRTIKATVASILASDYPSLEIIVVNDGSTDSTEEVIADFIKQGRIKYIKKPNGGKASALNRGIEAAAGDVVIFTDADSLFLPDTVRKMVRWFGDPSIDAVCGNDAPLHPSSPIQKFLAVTTHIGTGFVRRALSVMHCLPIITGNLGAIRTGVLRELKGFKEIWGEDLEITFRLYKNRKRIIFDPDPKVIAECPGTIQGLWKQRIRWVRSYIKIVFLHKGLFFNARYSPFSFYLPINFINMTIVPLLQIVILALIPWAYATEHLYFTDTIEILAFLGVIFFFIIAVYSIVLDKSYYDLIYLPYGLLILPFSYFYNFVAAYSWWKELQGAEEIWEKIERRKVIAINSNSWKYTVVAILLIIVSSAGTYYYMSHVKTEPVYKPAFSLGLSTHFDAWGDWRKAISNITNRSDVAMAKVVGVSAGRPEWVYFKWKGHEDVWSNHQKGAKEDLIAKAAATFHKSEFKVAAFIDIFGPEYLKKYPGAAAVGFDGKQHGEQLGFMEIVEGEYGKLILEMIEYLCKNYTVDIINLTEMPYYSYSYNLKDLNSYKTFSKRTGWPMGSDGTINRDDPSIWEWRSSLMEGYIKRAADITHKYQKELYIDVPVSWNDFRQNAKESGLDYRRVLKYADNIVVWNYFYLENLPPTVSESLSRYLAENFPANSFYVSLGLWGKKDHMDSKTFSDGLKSALKGGATRIWVTPDSLITDEHWKELLYYIKG